MRPYTIPLVLSIGLLAASGLARLSLYVPQLVEDFAYLMWAQVAILALGFYGFWVLRKRRSGHNGGLLFFLRGIRLWSLALAVPVVVAILSLASDFSGPLSSSPDRTQGHSRSYVAEGSRYFLVLDRTEKLEISHDEYISALREVYVLFSSVWIVLSYTLIVLWHYNWRRANESTAG